MYGATVFRLRGMFLSCFFFACLVLVTTGEVRANDFPDDAQKAVNAILEQRDPASEALSPEVVNTFLSYAMSPLSHQGDAPAKRKEGHGIIWRNSLGQPFATVLRYLFNPGIPNEIAYPASVRRSAWLPGSDMLSLKAPLWEELGKHGDQPLVLRGKEYEAITPDTFSGAYYSYTLDRLFLLTEYEGRQVLVTVAWQDGKSEVGKKAAYIGEYEDWDFIYSDAAGTLKSGIGWADTYMYASCAIIVFYEEAAGSNSTGYTVFKWLDAGWSSMNMVKAEHIASGAERSFKGLKAFLESPALPPAEELAAYVESLRALDEAALRERFKPYSLKVSELAAGDSTLSSSDFQKVIADGGYGDHLSKKDIIAAMCVNYIKGKLGKPQLAGPLE